MDDPTKDTIPRSAVEYCLRKETVSTNPEKYKTHEKFIDYMNDPDISEFGHWMHSNGFNCALTTISVDLKKIPSVTPKQLGWIPWDSGKFPEESGTYTVTAYDGATKRVTYAKYQKRQKRWELTGGKGILESACMDAAPGTVERGKAMKSRLSDIGYAVMDLIEAYQRAKASEFVRDPVCYALYQTWRKYDRARKEKEGDAVGRT